jgi:hypothetical protein
MDLNSNLNSRPRLFVSFEITASTTHALSKLECGFVTEEFKTFIITAVSVGGSGMGWGWG